LAGGLAAPLPSARAFVDEKAVHAAVRTHATRESRVRSEGMRVA